ncbi:MAG TPA: PQQ-dependent sugar dehydrogenase [Candidatus Levybacteria bacterium]|nr:PQQ-dependent sugar dehydrogenase [Candidatus Levybacteria bacterium]
MKRIILAGVLFMILSIAAGALWFSDFFSRTNNIPTLRDLTPTLQNQDAPRLTTIAQGLEVPWEIVFLPNDLLLVTERAGRVIQINPQTGDKTVITTIAAVKQIGEGGLHGITLHPNFAENNYVYVYYTYAGQGNSTQNRVVRFTYENNTFSNEEIIVDAIPGASNHDGGRIAFGPDDYLYITTGDAQEPSLAQTTSSQAGKILRVTDTGEAASDNPFNSRIYSYGHRNPQGLCWDNTNQLFSTEHGPSGTATGYDELNLIRPGINYGWPTIQGDETQQGMQTPLLQSGSQDTWAPAGTACMGSSVFFGGLRGNALYEAEIQGDAGELKTHLKGELGRIRAVVKGPDNMLYISTSNKDGRGVPSIDDDKIIRVNPTKL